MSWRDFLRGRGSSRGERPHAETRTWVHPSELPSFDALPATTDVHYRSPVPRIAVATAAVLLIIGAIVLMVNRGVSTPSGALPAHVATSVSQLPSDTQQAASRVVDLTIDSSGHTIHVAALVLPNNLAVTTTFVPVNAAITGSTATKTSFPVTLVGRDDIMGFSILHLGVSVSAPTLAAMPASTAVTAVAPIEGDTTSKSEFYWSLTTLGDPTNTAQGVVHYLAAKSDTSLSKDIDAIAVNNKGDVVAVLSSSHSWYAATFVAKVAEVVAVGRGCHADLGISGKNEQGGGVVITAVATYGSAAHAGLKVGDVITNWNGAVLDTWNQLASTLYLTPAYTNAHVTYESGSKVEHAIVTLGCPSKLEP